MRSEGRRARDVAAFEEDRRPRDVRVKAGNLVALRREAIRSLERTLGVIELPEPRVRHREKPRQNGRRERIRSPLERFEGLAQQRRALAELSGEHRSHTHERLRDRVRGGVAELDADLLGLFERLPEPWARLDGLAAHAAHERDPEVRVAEQPTIGVLPRRIDGPLELFDRAAKPRESPPGFGQTDRSTHAEIDAAVVGRK